jgi:hypothetical protein|uniref:Uncharacterized protein n=1 Tax=viral metagenome TaxID=1070528 RepID=A0A6C0JD75_9ZZZZ
MKLYIDDNTIILSKPKGEKIVRILKDYIVDITTIYELVCDQGVYRIENGVKMNRLIYEDGDIEYLENYIDDMTFILDKTIIKKDQTQVSHIPHKHIQETKIATRYKLRNKSPLVLVIEEDMNGIVKDFYFQLNDNYAAYSSADLDNIFIKEDINKFISFLLE